MRPERCGRALAFEMIDLLRLERMLKNAQCVTDESNRRVQVIPLRSRFARDPMSFATRPAAANSEQEIGGAACVWQV
jgi:hypothetical protein